MCQTTAMIPSLSAIGINGKRSACEPVGMVVLNTWEDRIEQLDDEQTKMIPESYSDSRVECAICMQALASAGTDGSFKIVTAVDVPGKSCGHSFHLACARKYFDTIISHPGPLTCPVCRKPFLDAEIDRLYSRLNGRRAAASDTHTLTRVGDPDYPPVVSVPTPTYPWLLLHVDGPNVVFLYRDYSIKIPNDRNDWLRAAYEAFVEENQLDSLSWGRWESIMDLPVENIRPWIIYYRTIGTLNSAVSGFSRSYDAASGSFGSVINDAREARREGASWQDIMRALLFGEDGEGDGG